MLGKRAMRTGRTAGRAAGDACTPAPLEVSPQAFAQSSLATAGVAAIDILPARGGRGLRRRQGSSTAPAAAPAPVAVAPVAVAPVGVLAAGAAERRSAEALFAEARSAEPVFAQVRSADNRAAEPSSEGRSFAEPGFREPALVALGTSPAELAEVPSLFVALPAEVADVVTEPIGRAAPVAVALAAQDDAEPQPAPSSLFASVPSAVVPVAEIVPTAAPAAAAAAEAPSLFAPAPAGTTSGPDTPAAQSLRERSAMASQALSELSALSSYRPEGQPAAPGEEPLGARRGTRNVADVRSMLSGFRAAGERGRATTAGAPVPEQAQAPDRS